MKGQMDKDIKRKWIRKLRGKNINQIDGQLWSDGSEGWRDAGFCCMGVLAIVMGGKTYKTKNDNCVINFDGVSFPCSFLSKARLKGVGLKEEDQDKLIDMNDQGHTFSEIADYIRDNL